MNEMEMRERDESSAGVRCAANLLKTKMSDNSTWGIEMSPSLANRIFNDLTDYAEIRERLEKLIRHYDKYPELKELDAVRGTLDFILTGHDHRAEEAERLMREGRAANGEQ